MTATTENLDAWAFVLRHKSYIHKLSNKLAGALSHDDREEWARDVMVRVVSRHHLFDASKSAPETWIYWQCRAVTTTWTRRFHARVREGYGQRDLDGRPLILGFAIRDGEYGSHEHALTTERQTDAQAQVANLYLNATPAQRHAMRTIVATLATRDMTDRELNRTFGTHLRALRASLED